MSEQHSTSGTNAAVPLTLADLNSVEFTPEDEVLMAEALRRARMPTRSPVTHKARRPGKAARRSTPR